MKHGLAVVFGVALALACKPALAQDVAASGVNTGTLALIEVQYDPACMLPGGCSDVLIDEASLQCFVYDPTPGPFAWRMDDWSAFVDPFADIVDCGMMGAGEYLLAGGEVQIPEVQASSWITLADPIDMAAPITVTAPLGYKAFVGVPPGSTAPPLSDVFVASGYIELARFYVVHDLLTEWVYMPVVVGRDE